MGDIREHKDAEFYAEWLRRRIEALVEEPLLWSKSAYTPQRTVHAIFRNGRRTQQGNRVDSIAGDSIAECAVKTYEAIREYAETVPADKRCLVWRVEPEIRQVAPDKDGYDIYVRLAFEKCPYDPADPSYP